MSCPDIWISRAIQFSTRFRQVTAIAGTIGISQRLALPKGGHFHSWHSKSWRLVHTLVCPICERRI